MRKRHGRLGRVLLPCTLLVRLLVVEGTHAQTVEASSDEEPEFEAVAEVKAPPREATKRTLPREQLTTVPGTRGDALRAIEIMPGVARAQFGTNPGPPSLRGGPPSDAGKSALRPKTHRCPARRSTKRKGPFPTGARLNAA